MARARDGVGADPKATRRVGVLGHQMADAVVLGEGGPDEPIRAPVSPSPKSTSRSQELRCLVPATEYSSGEASPDGWNELASGAAGCHDTRSQVP